MRPAVAVRAALVVGAVLVVAVGAVLGSRETVFRVESESMAPAVGVGDIVVAGRIDADQVARSDIVVFTDPGEWAESASRLTGSAVVAGTFVKRIIGMPDERVACCDAEGRVTVDGEPLSEPYLAERGSLASVLAFDVTVPGDAVFVLGDNRAASIDSRYLGVVPLSSLVAVQQFTVNLP